MRWLSIIGELASIAGLVVSAFALVFAKAAKQAAKEARGEVRMANAGETLERIGSSANLLQACLERNELGEVLVRARDLTSEISKVRQRYGRFLDSESKARLDAARREIGVISETVLVEGMPNNAAGRRRMLRTCREYVVEILNEESAKIRAVIEREQE